jgi:hypothetical protein
MKMYEKIQYENIRKYMNMYENEWKYMQIYENT